MSRRAVVVAVVVALALGAGPAAAAPVAPPPFQPTAFSVRVRGHGRPIILIPGLGCPGSVWAGTVEHFHDAQTHVLTLAGFAGQPAITEPISAATRRDLAAYIRDRKLDHPIIIGHSLGGFIALWLAESEPDLVGPVVVVDAYPALGGDAGTMADAAARAATWKASPAQFRADARDMFLAMANDAHVIAPVIDAVLRSDRRAFADAWLELVATDLRPALAKITARVLIVLADGPNQDPIRAQVDPIAHHDVVVVPKTRHFVMLDDPSRFFRAVDDFLAERRRP